MDKLSSMAGRRQILKWATVTLSVLVPMLSPKLALAANFNARRTKSLRNAMLTVFKNQEAARAVGEQYLKDHLEDRDAIRLAGELFGSQSSRLSTQYIRHVLNRRRVEDFTNDQCAVVGNWVLARSEARACALIALL